MIDKKSDLSDFENEPKTEKLLFFLLGNAALLAFNIIINAVDIFSALTGRNGAVVATNLNRAYNIPCSLAALCLCIIKPKNLKITLIVSLSVVTLLIFALPIFLLVDMDKDIIYWGSIVTTALIAIFSSAIFSSSYNFAGQHRADSISYVSSGNGVCGVLASIMRIITKAIKDTAIINSCYFFLAAAIFIGTLIYFIINTNNEDLSSRLIVTEEESEEDKHENNIMHIIKTIWVEWFSVFLNYCITLTVYPGYISNTEAGSLASWSFVIITSTFALFDLIGRMLPSYFSPIVSLKWAWVPHVLRLSFFAIFMLSIEGVVNFGDPWWTYGWNSIFALTNGYFGTISMVYGNTNPGIVDPEDKRIVGFMMPFAVNAGILVAMFITFAMPTK